MSLFVRKQPFFLLSLFCFFLTVSSYCLSSDLYQVLIEKDKQALGLLFKKDSHIIFDARLPYTKNGYDLSNLALAEPYVQYIPKTQTFTITLNEPENKCALSITRDGLITLSKLDVQNPFLLRVDGEDTSIKASNMLIAHSDFKLMARDTRYFISDVSARLEIGGNACVDLPKGVCKIYTALRADQDITIDADRLELAYGDVVKQVAPLEKKPYCDDEYYTLTRTLVTKKKHPHAYIQSKKGNIDLKVNYATIDAGALIAHKDVKIDYKRHVKAKAHCNKQAFHQADCTKRWVKDDDCWITKDNYDLCDNAVITAGGDILDTYDGKKVDCKGLDKSTWKGALICNVRHIILGGSIHNEGFQHANGNFHSTSSGQGKSYIFHNSFCNSTMRPPSFHTRCITFKDCIEKGHVVKQPSKHKRYMYVHPFNPEEEEIRLSSMFAFSFKEREKYTGDEQVLLSSYLQAEALSGILFEATQMPNLSGLRNNDYIELLNHLHDTGLLTALVRGTLQQVRKGQDKPCVPCTAEEEKDYQEILKKYGTYSTRLTPYDLKERFEKVQAGTHIPTLSQEQIHKAPFSFIYYTIDTYNDKRCIVPVIHITQKDFQENYQPATIKGKQVIIDNAHQVVNTGVIHSVEKLKIEAKTIVNESSITRRFNIQTPLASGQMVGFDVELTVPKEDGVGIYNRGGTIFGTQNLSLIANSGDIKNTAIPLGKHTLNLDQEAFDALFSQEDQIIDYYPGRLISGGNMKVVAQAGHFLNEASRMVAKRDMHIKAYAGVVLRSLVSHHVTRTGPRINGMSVEQLKYEASRLHQASVQAGGDINITSEGDVTISAVTFDADALTFDAKNVNNESVPLESAITKEKVVLGIGGLKYVVTTMRHTDNAKTIFNTKKPIIFKSKEDTVLEAIVVNNGQKIHIMAGRNAVIKGATEKTEFEEDGWFLSVTFFGSQSIEDAFAEDEYAALWSLIDEDPLLRALHNLKDAQEAADKAAYCTYASMEAARLFLAYAQQAKTSSKPFSKTMLNRLGLTDAQGNLSLRNVWRVGFMSEHVQQNYTKADDLNDVTAEAGGQVLLLDGPNIKGKFKVDANSVQTTPGTNTTSTTVYTCGVSAGSEGGVGFDFSTQRTQSTTHINGLWDLEHLNATIQGDFDVSGTNVNAKTATSDIGGNLYQSSYADSKTSDNIGGSFYYGLYGASGSFTFGHDEKQTVTQPSGMYCGSANITIHGDTYNNGAYMTCDTDDCFFKTRNYYYKDIPEHAQGFQTGFAFSHNTQGNDIAGINTVVDAGIRRHDAERVTRATVSSSFHIDAQNDISGLNRDMSRMQGDFEEEGYIIRFVVPIIDTQKFGQGIEKVKELFSQKKKENFETIAQTIDELAKEQQDIQDTLLYEAKAQLILDYINEKIQQGETLSSDESELYSYFTTNVRSERVIELMRAIEVHIEQTTHTENTSLTDDDSQELGDLDSIAQEPTSVEESLSHEEYELSTETGEKAILSLISLTDTNTPTNYEPVVEEHDHDDLHTITVTDEKFLLKLEMALSDYEKKQAEYIAYAIKEGLLEMDQKPSLWRVLLSTAVGMVPFASQAKTISEILTGRDYIAGQDVSRALAATSFAFPFIRNTKSFKAAIKPLTKVAGVVLKGAKRATVAVNDAGKTAYTKLFGILKRFSSNNAAVNFLLGGKFCTKAGSIEWNNSIIDIRKLTEYALSETHPIGKHKAKVFQNILGFNKINAQILKNQILEKLPQARIVESTVDQFGKRFTADILVDGLNGNQAVVRTGWIVETNSIYPKLTTLYVKK